MPCPIPLRIINPKYKKLSKDANEDVTQYEGRDDYYIDVPCGRCYHCRKSYKTQWNLRLQHHFKYLTKEQQQNSYFVTLTFSNQYLPSLHPDKEDISPLIRKFLERVRKHYKRSVTHWIVSEYGDTTERYHLHGILFDAPFPIWKLRSLWTYGHVTYAQLTQKRITYVTTYVNKQIRGLLEEPDKRQHVFSSPGIGKSFTDDELNRAFSIQHDTPVPFIYHNNRPFAMPRYYRGKFFTDEQREDMTQKYFFFRDDADVPPPPYFIGKTKYTDYTLYLRDCSKLRKQYDIKYKTKKPWQTNLITPCHDF